MWLYYGMGNNLWSTLMTIAAIVLFILYLEEKKKRKNLEARLEEEEKQKAKVLKDIQEEHQTQMLNGAQQEHQIHQTQSTQQAQPTQVIQGVKELQEPVKQSVPNAVPVQIQQQHVVTENTKTTKSAINVLLWIGVVFIAIAGLIFGTTSWNSLGDIAKVVILMGIVLVFFGMSAASEKVLKIRQTGMAFYILGCIFLPLGLIASAYFELFGEWFTYKGNGAWLFWSACSVLLGTALAVGVLVYKRNWLFVMMMTCISATVCFVIDGTAENTGIVFFALYFLSLACVYTGPWIKEQYKKSMRIFTKVHFFGPGLLLILVEIMKGYRGWIELLALGILLGSLVLMDKKEPKKSYRIWFCLYYVLIFAIIGDNIQSVATTHIVLAVMVLLSFFAFDFLTKKKICALRMGLSDGLFLSVIPIAISDLYMRRGFFTDDSVFLIEITVWIVISMIMILFITMEKKEKRYAKVLAFLVPIQICMLIENVLYQAVPRYTSVWVQGLLIIGIASILQIWQRKQKRLRSFELPFLITAIIVSTPMFLEAVTDFQVIYPCTFLSISYIAMAGYLWVKSTIARKEERKEKGTYYLALTYMTLIVFLAIPVTEEWGKRYYQVVIEYNALITGVFAGILIVIGKLLKKKENILEKRVTFFAEIILGISSMMMVICYTFDLTVGLGIVYAIITMLCLTAVIVSAIYERRAMAAIHIVFFAIFMVNFFIDTEIGINAEILLVEVMLCLLVGRRIFPKFYLKTNDGEKKFRNIDIFAIAAAVLILVIPSIFINEKSITYGFIATAVFFLNFCKRGLKKKTERVMLTLAGAVLVGTWWVQPWIRLSGVIATEFALLPIIGFAIYLQVCVWREKKAAMENLTYGCTIFTVMVLVVDALIQEQIFDVLFLGITGVGVLLYSFYLKRKKWFYLATIVLLSLALYSTRNFWLSIAWWIYLLFVGALLIFIAAQNERLKQKGSSIKKNVGRLWEDWTW